MSENTKLDTRSQAVYRLADLERSALIALAFGGAALLVIQAGLTLEIPDTGVVPEVIFTAAFTMLMVAALPARVRRPAWWSFGPASPGQ